jgi:iron complex transport system ATP-binding protein
VSVGTHQLVDDVSFDVGDGTWTTIVGPNGAGKSSLIETMAGLRRPATGGVSITGHDVHGMNERERARHVAFVPQHPVMPSGLTVSEYVTLGRTAHAGFFRSPKSSDRDIVASVLSRVALSDLAMRDVASLSGGERQRAVIGRALAQSTTTIFLDEPTTGLDLRHQIELLDVVKKEVRECGLTVVATLHDLTLATQYADRLVVIDGGHLVTQGESREVIRTSALAATFGIALRVLDVDGVDVVVPVRH